MNYTKELKFDSSQRNISLVEKFVEEICEENYLLDSYFGNIMLAIEEAVENAIVHGNHKVGQKQVSVFYFRRKNELSFIIEDEGDGFNHENIPNPLDSKDFSGTGIFLMRSLADKVNFNSKGNSVELVFSISCINQETTLNRISLLKKYFEQKKSIESLKNFH
jgi:serine/threonine-protein kinase RsbW